MTIILEHLEQGSQEWKDAKAGNASMSRANDLLTKGQSGKPSKTRETYVLELAAEVLTGNLSESVNTYDMRRGTLLEPYAFEAYSAQTGAEARNIGLGYLDDMKRILASPDGLGLAVDRGLEIKCPGIKKHMRTIHEGVTPKDNMNQCQGGMWIFGVDKWDFVSFCPEFTEAPLFIATAYRDDKLIARLSDSAHLAIQEADEIARKARMVVSHDLRKTCAKALMAIDEMNNVEPEIY